MNDRTDDGTAILDAKVAAAEARTDTKFAELIGRIEARSADAKGDARELRASLAAVQAATSGLKATIVVTGIGIFLSLVALLLATATYGDAVFSRGMAVRDVVTAAAREQQAATQAAVERAVRELQQSRP